MKGVLKCVLFAVVSACCSSWLRDTQTAKNVAFVTGSTEPSEVQVVPIVQPPTATNVKDVQVDVTFVLTRDLNTIPQVGCPCECAACRYYIDAVLVANVGQGASLLPLGDPTTDLYFPVSLPRNDSNVLYGAVGTVNCYDDEYYFEYNSANDPSFTAKYPDGIQLNGGDQISILWQFRAQATNCDNFDGNVKVQSVGIGNYFLSYGDCPTGNYEDCVAEIIENEKHQDKVRKH